MQKPTDASACEFVSTDGIAKSCVFEGIPYSSSFSDNLRNFAVKHLPNHPFALVSGGADTAIPKEFPEFRRILENPFCRAWFTQNYSGSNDPRIHPVPVGLDYHTLEAGRAPHWGPQMPAVEQEAELKHVLAQSRPVEERAIKGYCNFHLNLGWLEERKKALRLPEQASLSVEPHWVSRRKTWEKMVQHAFVLSPFGVGMDCHRTWEALILGCIPIVNMSPFKSVFEGLPVWFIDDWRQVTTKTMYSVLEQFRGKTFSWEKLTLKYWMDQIRSSTNRNIEYAKTQRPL